MSHSRLRRQQRMYRAVAATTLIAPTIAAAAAVSSSIRSQTSATSEPPLVLRSRELPPTGGGPAAELPNYAKTALTLRHWRQPEITFHVTPDPKDSRSADDERSLVAQGLALWDDKLGKKLVLRLAKDGETPDVEVRFAAPGTIGGPKIGDTEVQFTDPQNDIMVANVVLAEGLSAEKLVQDVAHECGHVLGIQGHSDEKSDLMYPYAVHFPAEISERDFNTIEIAYYQVDTSKKVRDIKRGQKFGSAKSF